jgi:hypothetical protein
MRSAFASPFNHTPLRVSPAQLPQQQEQQQQQAHAQSNEQQRSSEQESWAKQIGLDGSEEQVSDTLEWRATRMRISQDLRDVLLPVPDFAHCMSLLESLEAAMVHTPLHTLHSHNYSKKRSY